MNTWRGWLLGLCTAGLAIAAIVVPAMPGRRHALAAVNIAGSS